MRRATHYRVPFLRLIFHSNPPTTCCLQNPMLQAIPPPPPITLAPSFAYPFVAQDGCCQQKHAGALVDHLPPIHPPSRPPAPGLNGRCLQERWQPTEGDCWRCWRRCSAAEAGGGREVCHHRLQQHLLQGEVAADPDAAQERSRRGHLRDDRQHQEAGVRHQAHSQGRPPPGSLPLPRTRSHAAPPPVCAVARGSSRRHNDLSLLPFPCHHH